jgi:hypothetical protein
MRVHDVRPTLRHRPAKGTVRPKVSARIEGPAKVLEVQVGESMWLDPTLARLFLAPDELRPEAAMSELTREQDRVA